MADKLYLVDKYNVDLEIEKSRLKRTKTPDYKKFFKQEWDNKSRDYVLQVYEDWKTEKLKQGIAPNPINPLIAMDVNYFSNADKKNPLLKKIIDQPDFQDARDIIQNYDEYQDFENYFLRRQKERIKTIDNDELMNEIKQGGIRSYRQGNIIRGRAFTSSLYKSMFFNVLNFGDSIYGDKIFEAYSGETFAGQVIGTIAGYTYLSSLTAKLGMPKLINKMANNPVFRKTIIRGMGTPTFLLQKAGLIKKAMDITEHGVWAVNSGLVGSIGGSIQGYFKTAYDLENKLVNKEIDKKGYNDALIKNTTKGFVEGFANKYLLNLVNAPRGKFWSYPARILGDVIWSMGSQIYGVATKKQDKINFKQFGADMIIGHFLGEMNDIVLNIPKSIITQINNDKAMRFYTGEIKKVFGNELNDTELFLNTSALFSAEQNKMKVTGERFTKQERINAVNTLNEIHKENYDFIKVFDVNNIRKVDVTTKNKFEDLELNKKLKFIKDKFGLVDNEIALLKQFPDALNDKSDFYSIFKAIKKTDTKKAIVKSATVDDFKPISYSVFHDGMDKLVKKILGNNFDLQDIWKPAYENTGEVTKVIEKKPAEIKLTPDQLAQVNDFKKKVVEEANTKRFLNSIRKRIRPEDDPREMMSDAVYVLIRDNAKIHRYVQEGRDPKKTLYGTIPNLLKQYIRLKQKMSGIASLDEVDDTGRSLIDSIGDSKNYDNPYKNVSNKYNSEFNVLLNYASKSPDNLKSVLIYVMSRDPNMGYSSREILQIFDKLGIKIYSLSKIQKIVREMPETMRKQFAGDPQSKIITVKRSYTPNEIEAVRNQANSLSVNTNRLSEFSTNLDDNFAKQQIKSKGGYVISLNRDYEIIREEYGQESADLFIRTASDIIKNIRDDNFLWNKYNLNINDIFIKHPSDNNNTKFILYSKDMPEADMESITSYIYRRLRDNFNRISEPEKRFGIIVQKDGQKRLLTSFQNINILYSKNIDTMLDQSSVVDNLYSMMSGISPDFKNFFNMKIFDADNPTFTSIRDMVNSGTIDTKSLQDLNAFKTLSIEDPAPVVKENWHKMNPVLTEDQESFGINQRDFSEDTYGLRIEKELQNDLDKIIDISNIDSLSMGLSKDVETVYYKYNQILDRVSESNKPTTALGFIKKFYHSLYYNARSFLDIFYGAEDNPHIQSINTAIHNIAGSKLQIQTYAPRIMIDDRLFKPFVAKIKNKKDFINFNQVYQFFKEKEIKLVYDENKLVPVISEAQLKEPIKNYEQVEKFVELMVKNPRIYDNIDFFSKFVNITKDKLAIAKLIVQKFNIPFNDFMDFIRNAELSYYRPLRILNAQDFRHISQYDNYDFWDNIKNSSWKEFKEKVLYNTPLPKNLIDKIDISNEQHLKAFKKLLDTTAGLNLDKVKEWGQRADYLWSIDPDGLSWTTHRIFDNVKLRKKFISKINSYMTSERFYGPDEIDPVLKEFKNRKFATFEELSKAGYRVMANTRNVYASTMVYSIEKHLNNLIVKRMKKQYLDQFMVGYKTYMATEGEKDISLLTSSLDNIGGYFYLPTQKEFENITKIKSLYEKRMTEVKQKNTTYDKEFLSILEKEYGQILDQESAMKLLLGFYQSPEFASQMVSKINLYKRYIPMSYKSFKTDNNIHSLTDLKSNISEFVTSGKYKAPTLTGWDGIYLHEPAFKSMIQFVFRQPYKKRSFDEFWKTKAFYGYERVNSTLKMSALVNASIGIMNNTQQTIIGRPQAFTKMTTSLRAFLEKDDPNSEFGKRWWEVEKYNTRNISMEIPAYVSDIEAGYYKLIGKMPTFGKGMDDIFGKKDSFKELIKSAIAVPFKMGYSTSRKITWGFDGVMRQSMFESFYDEVKLWPKLTYEQKMQYSADMTNLFMVNYSRVPHHARQSANLLSIYFTYKVGTFRMYKEMLKMSADSVLAGLGMDKRLSRYSMPDDVKGQMLYNSAPILRTMATTAVIKAIPYAFFGYAYDNLWDFITGYRASKLKGSGLLDTEIRYLSFSGPLFAIQKYITRSRNLTALFRYELAPIPALGFSIITGTDMITAQSWYKESDDIIKNGNRFMFNVIRRFVPFGSSVLSMTEDNKNVVEKILSFTGVASTYSVESPASLLKKFRTAVDESQSIKDREDAFREFKKDLNYISQALFKREYKDYADDITEMNNKIQEFKKKRR